MALDLAEALSSLRVLAKEAGESMAVLVPRGGVTAWAWPNACVWLALWGMAAARACTAACCSDWVGVSCDGAVARGCGVVGCMGDLVLQTLKGGRAALRAGASAA